MIVSYDCETYPLVLVPKIGKHKANRNAIPKLVCLSYRTSEGDEGVVKAKAAVDLWLSWLADPKVKIVGLNLAFDNLVMVRAVWQLKLKDCLPDLIEAYEDRSTYAEGRFHDVSIRQQLIDIATQGQWPVYSLKSMAKRLLKKDVAGKDEDSWRVRYNELEKYPVRWWPEDALDYALEDARIPLEIYELQTEEKYNRGGRLVVGDTGVANETFQTEVDLVISLMSTWGFAVDPAQVKKVKANLSQKRDKYQAQLQDHGIVDEEGKENKTELRKLFEKAAFEAGIEPILTEKSKEIATNQQAREALEDAGVENPVFVMSQHYGRMRKFLSTYVEPMELAWPYSLCPNYHVLAETGRLRSSKPNVQNLPKRAKKSDIIDVGEIRRCFVPRPGNVYLNADYMTLELRTLAQVHLNLRKKDPNYPVSEMAKTLQSGRDLHTDMASQVLGVDYDLLVAVLEDKHHRTYSEALFKEYKKGRSLVKVANFGYPGGLQAMGFVAYARGFGIKITPGESQELRDNWMARWSEMDPYFRYVRSTQQNDGRFYIDQHGPQGRVVGWRCRATWGFPAACNTLFQGLAADGVKYVGIQLMKACYIDKDSPLYGYRINTAVHDEFLLEGPEETASEALDEMMRIMETGMRLFVPDIPTPVDGCIMRRWDVSGFSERGDDGKWTIYDNQAKEAA